MERQTMFTCSCGSRRDWPSPTRSGLSRRIPPDGCKSRALRRRFQWQGGYGTFSGSQSKVAEVVRYIPNQEKHHPRGFFPEKNITPFQKAGKKNKKDTTRGKKCFFSSPRG